MLAAGIGAAEADCGHGDFSAWREGLRQEAAASGISAATLQIAAPDLRFDPGVVKRDRAQGVFSQDFLKFSDRMISKNRLSVGASRIAGNAGLFSRIEEQFGVPAAVLVAFWGLETDFGANIGDLPTLTSLSTLAFDCRRPDMFRTELLSALKLLDRGDLELVEMRGPWAGELGQTQFLPSKYIEFGVDFDGDGRIDMIRSTADALASSANYISHLGWRRGEPWLQEVTVPADFPWEEADVLRKHPRSFFVDKGVTARDRDLAPDDIPVSLVLPMGRSGPAFLAYPNFDLYLEWNRSLVYSTTAAYYATLLAGAPKLKRGDARCCRWRTSRPCRRGLRRWAIRSERSTASSAAPPGRRSARCS
ncbi:Membrane-bound lytic murein transglycosylase B precursor [Methylobrevis pamukkalensis]|uniref:Membrane-bound lytic murein transglycosylase B n=1 Tax=Methylobrevis pamukkalensis TaxID=1439726 RepID=A0A1E3H5H0_9HYPH|nr:Membrane-bound lytic murein transglycosylase B precursor [Methylobrevis pamukkalensis]